MRCIIVNRVSDAKQTDGYSLDAQARHGEAYALTNSFNVIRVFTFQETASKVGQRKLFNEFIAAILAEQKKSPDPIHIVAEKPDRISRNHGDKEILQNWVLQGKVVIHYYKDGRIFDKKCTPSDIFIDDVMASIGRYTALNIGREAKKGMLEKCEQGWMPGVAPWGYKNIVSRVNNSDESIIVPDPRSVPLVRRIFQLRAVYNFSYDKIFDTVLKEGLVPAIEKKNGKLKSFHPSTVEKILKNEFYSGRFRFGDEKVFEGKHELFVPIEWTALVEKSFQSPSVGLNHHEDNLFGGWLVCGRDGCGCKISYHHHKKPSGREYNHYICANGKRVHASLKGMYITEEKLLDAFSSALDAITVTPKLASDIRSALRANHQRSIDRHKRQAESFNVALKGLEKREDQLYADLRSGILDEEGYKRQLKKVRDERELYSKSLHLHQRQELDAYLERADLALELATNAKTLWKTRTAAERVQMLKMLLWNPRLNPPSVEYELKKPFKLLAQMASSDKWGG